MQVHNAGDEDALRKCCLEEPDVIFEAGYTRPIALITLAEKEELMKTIKMHFVLLRSKAELDQL